jgi:hypothetical protein
VKTLPIKITNQNINEEAATGEDERGDLLIQGFWTAGACCILDVCVTDTDAKSHCKRTRFKVPELQEKEKKQKHLGACLWRIAVTSHLFCSQWMDCSEAKLNPSQNVSQQNLQESGRSQPHLQVCGCVKARLSTAAVCATHLCLRRSRVPADDISTRFLQWTDGAGSAMHEWT